MEPGADRGETQVPGLKGLNDFNGVLRLDAPGRRVGGQFEYEVYCVVVSECAPRAGVAFFAAVSSELLG